VLTGALHLAKRAGLLKSRILRQQVLQFSTYGVITMNDEVGINHYTLLTSNGCWQSSLPRQAFSTIVVIVAHSLQKKVVKEGWKIWFVGKQPLCPRRSPSLSPPILLSRSGVDEQSVEGANWVPSTWPLQEAHPSHSMLQSRSPRTGSNEPHNRHRLPGFSLRHPVSILDRCTH
jgi:hypothetical protein